jgi:hypothetical protein
VNLPTLVSEKEIARRRLKLPDRLPKAQRNQKIPFPMIAQGDAERESGEETTEFHR